MEQKKQPKLRKCRTVGELIKQLERLPKSAPLSDPVRPVFYNTSATANEIGLTPQVGFDEF